MIRHLPFLLDLYVPCKAFQGLQTNHSVSVNSEIIFVLIDMAVIALEIFDPGSYSGSQLCEVTPLLTTVQVAYGGDIMNIEKTLSSSTFDQIDPSGLMVYNIGQFISTQLDSAESSSMVGNPILSNIDGFVDAQPINLTELTWELILVSSLSVLGDCPVHSHSEIGGLLARLGGRIDHGEGDILVVNYILMNMTSIATSPLRHSFAQFHANPSKHVSASKWNNARNHDGVEIQQAWEPDRPSADHNYLSAIHPCTPITKIMAASWRAAPKHRR